MDTGIEQLDSVIHKNVADALAEDIGGGDLTSALVDEDALIGATIIAREPMIVAGQPWVDEVFAQLDERVIIDWYIGDGASAEADDVVCKLVGPARALLTGERTALNFLQTLSATATTTARYVAAVAGTKTRILDTRKTLPGLRHAQKYAVRCGGGTNHRFGLHDAVMIKDNHVAAAGSIGAAVAAVRAEIGHAVAVIVEVDHLDQIDDAVSGGADVILLDNLRGDDLRAGVEAVGGRATTEASGGITPETAPAVAEAGVDVISLGWLTHSAPRLDVALDM